jgi:hypothetical protein
MVEKCDLILGKRCTNWNHEGQWLIPGPARNLLNSGGMCPNTGGLTTAEMSSITSEVGFNVFFSSSQHCVSLSKTPRLFPITRLQQWKQYWNLDKVILVEKSPHSFLKIPLLRNMFKDALSVKFVILMKVPSKLSQSISFVGLLTNLPVFHVCFDTTAPRYAKHCYPQRLQLDVLHRPFCSLRCYIVTA